jgi:hypothetical protein
LIEENNGLVLFIFCKTAGIASIMPAYKTNATTTNADTVCMCCKVYDYFNSSVMAFQIAALQNLLQHIILYRIYSCIKNDLQMNYI